MTIFMEFMISPQLTSSLDHLGQVTQVDQSTMYNVQSPQFTWNVIGCPKYFHILPPNIPLTTKQSANQIIV